MSLNSVHGSSCGKKKHPLFCSRKLLEIVSCLFIVFKMRFFAIILCKIGLQCLKVTMLEILQNKHLLSYDMIYI